MPLKSGVLALPLDHFQPTNYFFRIASLKNITWLPGNTAHRTTNPGVPKGPGVTGHTVLVDIAITLPDLILLVISMDNTVFNVFLIDLTDVDW